MVSPAMRRYRTRSEAQATLVGPPTGIIDPLALFGRRAPLRLEIGCGHGEFISQMAAAHPDEDFIGLEIDPLRVTKCAHKCLKEGARNVRFFAGDAAAFLAERCPAAAFHRIYILFPDPWPKAAHRRRRLMNRSVLRDLARCAAPGCRLIFASDTHNYAMQVLSNLTTLPGLWRSILPAGYAIDLPVRFPTVFERHKRAEGCTIAHVRAERTTAIA
jgi:tRNA (guanine-N7-)-methyltransferase